jgi:hypothetical protein
MAHETAMFTLRQAARPSALRTRLNITVPTVVSAWPGWLLTVSVVRAGSWPGAIYDHDTIEGIGTATRIATIPAAIDIHHIRWLCEFGIVVVPGVGQTLAVTYA